MCLLLAWGEQPKVFGDAWSPEMRGTLISAHLISLRTIIWEVLFYSL